MLFTKWGKAPIINNSIINEGLKMADIAFSNLKASQSNVLNIECEEMGLESAKELGLTEHIAHYEAEIKRRKLEAMGFHPINIDKLVAEFTKKTNSFIASSDAVNHGGLNGYLLRHPVVGGWKTVGVFASVHMLKFMIPASILYKMNEIKNTGLVNEFYALGELEAFNCSHPVDPIIFAVINPIKFKVDIDSSTFYFIGRYS